MAVLPWRCFPMCQLSVFGDASVQTRREDPVGQQDPNGCLRHWFSYRLLIMIENLTFLWPSTETKLCLQKHCCKSCHFSIIIADMTASLCCLSIAKLARQIWVICEFVSAATKWATLKWSESIVIAVNVCLLCKNFDIYLAGIKKDLKHRNAFVFSFHIRLTSDHWLRCNIFTSKIQKIPTNNLLKCLVQAFIYVCKGKDVTFPVAYQNNKSTQ